MRITLKKMLILVLLVFPTLAFSWDDKSQLGTVDMVVCTAAVMKSGMRINVYNIWTTALRNRYKKMYPTKTVKEIDTYMSERIIGKRAKLENQGIYTAPAFKRFFDKNCKDFQP
jgi:hypothetical protein